MCLEKSFQEVNVQPTTTTITSSWNPDCQYKIGNDKGHKYRKKIKVKITETRKLGNEIIKITKN